MDSVNSLLPPNATALERNAAQVLGEAERINVPLRSLWQPQHCPKHLLPWLAWALSVDEWDDQWSEAQKRRAIEASVHVHRHKGTLGALQRALDAVDYHIKVVEWHQATPPAAPYTFRADVTLENRGLDDATQARILRLIHSAKNARSHLTALRMVGNSQCRAYVGGWEQSFDSVTVQPLAITQAAVPPSPCFAGATLSAYDITTVEPL